MPAEAGTAPEIREAPLELVRPLRHLVLRAGRPFESTTSDDDKRPDTRHLAAVQDDVVVGAVSFFQQPSPPDPSEKAIRFRAMAVHPAWQGKGVGTALMRALRERARTEGVSTLWANGRDTAQGFYQRIGFHALGDGFMDEEMHLPHHVVMARVETMTL